MSPTERARVVVSLHDLPCQGQCPGGGAPVFFFLLRLSSPDPCSRRETQDFRGQPYEIDFLPRGKVPWTRIIIMLRARLSRIMPPTTSSLLVKVEVGSDGLHRQPFHCANYAPTGTGFGARRRKSHTARWMLTDPLGWQLQQYCPTGEILSADTRAPSQWLLKTPATLTSPCSSDVWNRHSIGRATAVNAVFSQ